MFLLLLYININKNIIFIYYWTTTLYRISSICEIIPYANIFLAVIYIRDLYKPFFIFADLKIVYSQMVDATAIAFSFNF